MGRWASCKGWIGRGMQMRNEEDDQKELYRGKVEHSTKKEREEGRKARKKKSKELLQGMVGG